MPEASLTEEGLSISPIRKNENEAADAIIRRLYAMLPRLRVTELFAEVHGWTGFANRFAHLRTGAPPDDARALMTALLADATNLGLTRMARSSGAFSHSRLLWIAEWHVRDETYQAALACLIGAIHAQPISKIWGDGYETRAPSFSTPLREGAFIISDLRLAAVHEHFTSRHETAVVRSQE